MPKNIFQQIFKAHCLILDITFHQTFDGTLLCKKFVFVKVVNVLYFSFLKIDIDECTVSSNTCTCASQEENPSCNANCINNDGGYECECSDGYKIYEKKICIGKLCRILSIKSLGQCYKYVTNQK